MRWRMARRLLLGRLRRRSEVTTDDVWRLLDERVQLHGFCYRPLNTETILETFPVWIIAGMNPSWRLPLIFRRNPTATASQVS